MKSVYWRNFTTFWFLGVINNFGYVVVNSAAGGPDGLAAGFGQSKLIGLILWCNIALGIVARFGNTFFLEGCKDGWRVMLAGYTMTAGLLMVALSVWVNSWGLCLFGVIVIGTSSSFGESVLLGHMRKYSPDIVSGWSSGTGMAGVGGSLGYLLLVAMGLSNVTIFALLAPLGLVYCVLFFYVLVPPPSSINELSPEQSERVSLVKNMAIPLDTAPPIDDKSSKKRYITCLKLVWWNATQLLLVYFFEYVASVGGSASAQPESYKTSDNWFLRNSYAILAFCYQLGVLISRSSLHLFKVKKVEIITILQGANMVFWVVQAKYPMLVGAKEVWVLFALMVYVGLLGGGSYVNIFYLVLNDPKISTFDRELCVNITAIFVNVGITLSAAFILMMDNTFLAH
jgi:battenin